MYIKIEIYYIILYKGNNMEPDKYYKIIHHHDLNYNKYDISTLEFNIDRLGLKSLLQTQKLTAEFCIKYLLNPEEYGMCVEDSYISINDILLYQTHLTLKDF